MTNQAILTCPHCQEPIVDADEFCEACGRRLRPAEAEQQDDHVEIDIGLAAGVTDRGLHHRRNEDALHLATLDGAVVVVVCDGVSTSAAPQLAARAAAGTAGRILAEALTGRGRAPESIWDPVLATKAAMSGAQVAAAHVPWRRDGGKDAPSCTFVSAIWDGEAITVGWAGDSRAYWFSASANQQLTVDHSWAQEQVDAGVSDRSLAFADPRAHAITRWLGADAPDEPPQVASFRPEEPGELLVCSDGLWNYAPAAEDLDELLGSSPSEATPLEAARALVHFAILAGGHDNVTVAIVDLVPRAGTAVEEQAP